VGWQENGVALMKAMLLCAGYGTRLGRLVGEVPKPMLPVCGRPMLEHLVRHLARHGFCEIAINLHFRAAVIRDYFGDGSRFGVRLVYSDEPQLLGTAGSVKNMANFLAGSEPFLVQYGDVVTDQDFTAMLEFHRRRQALATLLVHQRAKSNSLVGIDSDQRIVAFLERPTDQQRTFESPWVNSGIVICESAMLDEIPECAPCDLPADVYTKLAPGGRLYAFPLAGHRYAVDSPQRLEEVRAAVERGFLAFEES
jgi:mannose-1-phosphate guanylyltransferase/phosphomannomutase